MPQLQSLKTYSRATARIGEAAVLAILAYIDRHGRRFKCGCDVGRDLRNCMVSVARDRANRPYDRVRCLKHHRIGAAESMKRARKRAAARRLRIVSKSRRLP